VEISAKFEEELFLEIKREGWGWIYVRKWN
jgi:hypothetical protein